MKPDGEPASFPVPVSEIRDRTLAAAGYDPERVGAFLRQATEKLVEQLEAKTTKFFAERGRITDSATVSDNQSQIAAAAQLISLGVDLMALKRRVETAVQQSPNVTIDFSGWSVTPPASHGEDGTLPPADSV